VKNNIRADPSRVAERLARRIALNSTTSPISLSETRPANIETLKLIERISAD
jgi:hypothetical protein